MKRHYSLKKNVQFQYVYRRGKSCANLQLVLLFVRQSKLRFGFSISKKVGNAVKRNHIKRLLRECIRPQLSRLKCGHYVFVARAGAAQADFHQIQRAVQNLLTRQHLYKEDKPPQGDKG